LAKIQAVQAQWIERPDHKDESNALFRILSKRRWDAIANDLHPQVIGITDDDCQTLTKLDKQ